MISDKRQKDCKVFRSDNLSHLNCVLQPQRMIRWPPCLRSDHVEDTDATCIYVRCLSLSTAARCSCSRVIAAAGIAGSHHASGRMGLCPICLWRYVVFGCRGLIYIVTLISQYLLWLVSKPMIDELGCSPAQFSARHVCRVLSFYDS